MSKFRFDRIVLAGLLASVAPGLALAAPDRVRSVLPPPPSLNGEIIRHHQQPQEPPPAPVARPRETPSNAVPLPRPEPVQAQAQQAPQPAQPAQQAKEPAPAESGFSLRGTLDRLFSASDEEIAPKLKDAVGKLKLSRKPHPEDRKALEAFYAARNYAPIWVHGGRLTDSAKAAAARLKNAGVDGLDAADYPVPDFGTTNSADALAAADVELSESLLVFARHLAIGRIAPTRVTSDVEYGDHTPDPDDVIKKLASAHDIDATIDSYNPPHAGFRSLKAKLAALRANASVGEDPNRIADGPVLKYGMKDARIPLMRERLHVRGNPHDVRYDKALYNAVRNLQNRHGLKPTGLIDSHVLTALNGPKPGQMVDTVMANLERWRWLPRDLGRTYVMVNIPDFTLKVVSDQRLVWKTKIVAGKPQTPTPLVTATMREVIVNPSWYVPQSIIQNELLPLYASDPNIFERMGLEVKRGADGNINVVQPPGAANALGRIKFAFPNKFQVYLHDTPEKRLFAYDRRAFSHGCMRVEDPTKFGEVMLSLAMAGPTPTEGQIMRMFGQEEKEFKLQKQPMVHLTYQTAYVDDEGKLKIDDDLYGFDARIKAIMHSDERRVADVAPPQDPKRDQASYKNNQEILRRVERREAQNPFSFFEQLFR